MPPFSSDAVSATGLAVCALVLALVGRYAWGRRGRGGAVALATLVWMLALWGLVSAAETLLRPISGELVYAVKTIVLLGAASAWFVFTLQYTGRERWLTRGRSAMLALVPAVTVGLVVAGNPRGLLWRWTSDVGEPSAFGTWFYVYALYSGALVLVGVAFLLLMLVNTQRLYGMQSFCLLVGFLPIWTVVSWDQLGIEALAGTATKIFVFVLMALALALALGRWRLLDISPVAHDAVVEGMRDGTMVLDLRNRIVDLNPAAAYILGTAAEDVVGRDFREVITQHAEAAPLEGNRGLALLRRYEEQGQAHEEVRLGKEDPRHYDLALQSLHDGRGKRTGHLVVLHEITERKLAVEKLDRMAHYDPLTGLANRATFYERLNQEIARNRRHRSLLALFFLDLDRFKIVNDTLGHDVGDMLLKMVAERIVQAVREYDVVARLAGDEFTVILPDVVDAAAATTIADRMVDSLSEPFEVAGNELRITTSVGIAFYPTDGPDAAALVRNADAAMYRAKAAGKNRYEMFAEDAVLNATRHLDLEKEMIEGLENGEFVLHYQPEMQISTSRMIGVETLLRWDHPSRGLLLPGDFLSVAEETGLIFSIERWVLREACRQMRSWQERFPTDSTLSVSVNLSPRHFMHPNLVGEVYRVLEETQLPPESLILEIKESALQDDALAAGVTLQALKKLGVKLAVDNFGTGFSSVSYLKSFPLDKLKIDRSFTANLQTDEDRPIVEAMVSLAHALNLTVVAEGVETARQLMHLRAMNCDEAQGFYFAASLDGRSTSAFLVADLFY
jgi:diguanylate cyclase (GGDEF)-like protein/PAS domain S-box-containing protein